MAVHPSFKYPANQSSGYQQSSDSQQQVQRRRAAPVLRRTDSDHSLQSSSESSSSSSIAQLKKFQHSYKKPSMPARSEYVAMDCEMVGTADGSSVCARVVLLDWKGRTILDTHVNVTKDCNVVDYRTYISGIREEDLKSAPSFAEVRKMVLEKLEGKILVGHGLENDLKCLQLTHPWENIRDTAYYAPFMQSGRFGQLQPRKLKELSAEKLNREIQVLGRSHCPTEDALAALDLYKSHRPRWEACVSSNISKARREIEQQQQLIIQQQMLRHQNQQRMLYMMQQGQQQYYAPSPFPAVY